MVVLGEARGFCSLYPILQRNANFHRSLSKDAPCHRAIERFGIITRDFSSALHHSYCRTDFRYNPRGFAYATSSSATGEPPGDESFDARYRDFARTPILVGFKLASCQQFVASRVAACEHLPSNFRPDNKRVRVISFSKAITHLLAPRSIADVGK